MDITLRAIPYDVLGVKLWSIEDMSGFTYFYKDTKEDAERKIKEMQENMDYYLNYKFSQ